MLNDSAKKMFDVITWHLNDLQDNLCLATMTFIALPLQNFLQQPSVYVPSRVLSSKILHSIYRISIERTDVNRLSFFLHEISLINKKHADNKNVRVSIFQQFSNTIVWTVSSVVKLSHTGNKMKWRKPRRFENSPFYFIFYMNENALSTDINVWYVKYADWQVNLLKVCRGFFKFFIKIGDVYDIFSVTVVILCTYPDLP